MRQIRTRTHTRSRAGLCMALLLLIGGCASRDAQLARRLDVALQTRAATGATFVARVVDLDTGRELYSRDADRPVMPASNMKLIVTAAALDMLGPDYVFRTYLAEDGDNLWILGTGDPGVGDYRIARWRDASITAVFDHWADALEERGLTTIPGSLYYWDGAFEALTTHPSWEHDDLIHWYAAPVSGLNFNDNCVDITVHPTEPGQPARYTINPPVADLTIINQCITGSGTAPRIDRMAYSDVYVLGGKCSKPTQLKSKPVGSPASFFADAFRTHLASRGISIEGSTVASATALDDTMPPDDAKVVAIHETPMADVMRRINQNSQNLFAECLHKAMGRAYAAKRGMAAPGSWALGEEAIRDFLDRFDIEDNGFEQGDGSGLSRDNRITARLMTDMLAVMHEHHHGDAYKASMATAGMGELRRRMKNLECHLWAKTGYIRSVRALSGYLKTRKGRWLAFSLIYNDIPSRVSPFNDLQDEAVRILHNWPDTAL